LANFQRCQRKIPEGLAANHFESEHLFLRPQPRKFVWDRDY